MYKRIVVKLGTSVLTKGTEHLNRAHMVELVRQSAQLFQDGKDVIMCTSGAIAAGKDRLGLHDYPDALAEKQMLAAVGQSRLMLIWERLFEIYDIHVGQILLTRSDIEDRRRFLNARDTLLALLTHRIIPIVNENDAVTTSEIKVGDNDNLSAFTTVLSEADLLILLTDQTGMFTADPRIHPDAELIPEVRDIDEMIHKKAGKSSSGLGVGGMVTKLQAADVARRAGADVVIASGYAPDVITKIVAGEKVGTLFPAMETPLENRKRWIFAGTTNSGRVYIDEGARKALVEQGGSLLPVGIVDVDGEFERGDTVVVINADQKEVAKGITRYGSEDLKKVQGLQSEEIAKKLGYAYGPAVIHRDDLILV